MAPSQRKAGPQRFYEYLDCLQEEFECRSNDALTKDLGPRRFSIYLGNLRGEFELMSLEIESLQRARDQYKEKVEAQAKELQNVRRSKAIINQGILASPQLPNALKAGSSLQPESLKQQSHWQSVAWSQKTTSCRSTPRMTMIRKHQPAITRSPVIPPSHPICRPSDDILGHSQIVTFASPASTSTVDPKSGVELWPEQRESSIFNSEVEKELDVEIAHTLVHEKLISCVNFSQDGKYVATGCFNGRAYIYDVESGTLTRVLRNLLAEKDLIRTVCFSPDGKYLATGLWGGDLYIWEIDTKYVRNAFKGHTHCVNAIHFSPNGRLLVSASDDNTVRLWDMRYGAAKTLAEDNPTFLDDPWYTSTVFSPNGLYVAASHNDGMVRIWNVRTGQLMRRVKAHVQRVYEIAFTPDRKGLVSGGGDDFLRYWDVSSLYNPRSARLQMMHDSRRGDPEVEDRPNLEFSHEDSVLTTSVSPDGRWVASGSYDKKFRIWDTHNAARQCILDHDDRIWAVDFSPAGRYFASGGDNCILNIWRYSTIAKPRHRFKPPSSFLPPLSCSTSPRDTLPQLRHTTDSYTRP